MPKPPKNDTDICEICGKETSMLEYFRVNKALFRFVCRTCLCDDTPMTIEDIPLGSSSLALAEEEEAGDVNYDFLNDAMRRRGLLKQKNFKNWLFGKKAKNDKVHTV